MFKKIIDKIEGKSIAILGFGKEGQSTYNFIRKYLPMQLITIVDKNTKIYNDQSLNKDRLTSLVAGDNYLDNINSYDIIFKSPGVKIPENILEKLDKKITSQMELTLELFKSQIIGITGTKGKSTTSSLIYEIIKFQNNNCYLLGNIGVPIFDYVDKFDEKSILVIEMSCLQLETVKFSPHISIILNLFEEHLDYFKTKEKYFLSKINICKYQNNDDYLLYISQNKTLNYYINNTELESILIDINNEFNFDGNYILYNNKKIYNTDNKRLLIGEHNLINILFALRVSLLLKLDINKTIETINNFKPLQNRMEFIGEYNGVKYYNDTIATIPEATINCINTLKNVDTIIFGGMDRGIDYSPLINFFNNCNIRNFICMPETGHSIAKKIANKNKNIYLVETLDEAVKKAKEVTKNICVLSPAAPSYNSFKNFEEKGNRFKELVKNND